MGQLYINIEKEWQVQYRKIGLNRKYINYFDTLEDAECDYSEKLNSDKFTYVELLECQPIKAFQK